MNKKRILIVLALVLLAAGGAFADFAVGLNGALYMDDAELEAATGRSIGKAFRSGEGVYYGLMAEFLGKYMGLGGSFMGSRYFSSFGSELLDLDLNAYVAAHVLGSRFVIDPSVEAGLGWIQKDYARSSEDDDPDNPLTATAYWYLGGGVELNIWRLGIFTKFIYHFPLGPVMGTGDLSGIPIEAFSLKPYKIVLGVKFIFG
jgi:hypothetical protein